MQQSLMQHRQLLSCVNAIYLSLSYLLQFGILCDIMKIIRYGFIAFKKTAIMGGECHGDK